MPKTDALVEAFSSLNLHFACITETWYRGGAALKDHLVDLEGAAGIGILHKSRDGRSKGRGGGVAIAFSTSSCNFKQRRLNNVQKDHEIVCAVGRIGKIARRVAIFCIYVPPSIRAVKLEELREVLATEVAAVKSTYKDPLIYVGGDFNHRDFGPALAEVEDMHLVETGPTRGVSTFYINAPDTVVDRAVIPPLMANSGAGSDHSCVFVAAKIGDKINYQWTVRMRRTRTQAREEAFAKDMEEYNWSELWNTRSADDMAVKLEAVIHELAEKHFPIARVRKRSN